MEKVLCYIDGTKEYLTVEEIKERELNVVVSKQDWRMAWTEIVQFGESLIHRLNGELTIWLTTRKKKIDDLKSYNT